MGNIRELRAVLSRLSLDDCNGFIDDEAVSAALGGATSDCRPPEPEFEVGGDANLHDLQRARILAAYAQTGNNISEAARRLGVSRNMIYRALQPKQK